MAQIEGCRSHSDRPADDSRMDRSLPESTRPQTSPPMYASPIQELSWPTAM